MKELQKNLQEETALDACKLTICRKVLAWLFHLYNPIGIIFGVFDFFDDGYVVSGETVFIPRMRSKRKR